MVFTKIAVVVIAGAFALLAGNARADELRVKQWPEGVPCSALTHKSDGSWALTDDVIGPDGTRHYPSSDRDSYENRTFHDKCK